jgi:glycosyltransferase involved in cell wall biosynthesis
MQISVIIIAKNEAENLKRSLQKLHWCDDIVLIDDCSSDQTAEIAASFGAKVFQRAFDGFGTQKQFAVAQTQYPWVLNLDADEVMEDALIQEILALNESEEISAYELPIQHVFLGKVFKHGKESNYPHLRLFNKNKGNFNDAVVHEKVITSGKTLRLKGKALHYSYKNLEHYFQKLNSYTQAGAIKLKEKGKSRSLFLCILSFPIYFVKHYFVYGNILNGKEGFIWSYLNAWYHTVKYLKLYELNQKK